jgi:hypothetical protein
MRLLLLSCLLLTACGDPPTPTVPKALIVKLQRLATSPPPTLAQVQPYTEGLVFHAYTVKEVLHGELTAPKIQLAHWAVVDSKEQSIPSELGQIIQAEILPFDKVRGADDLFQSNELNDYDSPLYIEVPPATQPVATGFRYQYGGAISKQMRLYWELRPQLHLVALGNSRTGVGVLTNQFDSDSQIPSALNLSPPGSNMELQSILAKDYLLPLPNLKWIVWGICPRYFNTQRRDSDRLDLFTDSHGRRYDLQNQAKLWPIPDSTPPVSLAQLTKVCPAGTQPDGSTPRPDGHSPDVSTPATQAKFLHDFYDIVRFKWDQPQWDLFVTTVTALDQKGIQVLLFTPPTHPLGRDGKACDPDGLSAEHDALVVGKLRALADLLPNVHFEDIHRAGHHNFPPEDFSDPGHLDQSGATRLTTRLRNLIKQQSPASQ